MKVNQKIKLEKDADIAYDEANYAKAADLYRQLSDISLEDGDLKAYTDNLYLCGICYCENKEYERGFKTLVQSYDYYCQDLANQCPETTRAILEAIVDCVKNDLATHENQHLILRLDMYLSELFLTYNRLNEKSRLIGFKNYISNLYDKLLMTELKDQHIISYNVEGNSGMVSFSTVSNGIKSICAWCIITNNKNAITCLASHYLNLYIDLNKYCHENNEHINETCTIICKDLLSAANEIGIALIDVFDCSTASSFLEKWIDCFTSIPQSICIEAYVQIIYLYAWCQKKGENKRMVLQF